MDTKYLVHKELLTSQIKSLYRRGGNYQKAAETVNSIWGAISNGTADDPFLKQKITKNGESRIKHCIKYDLNGYCRLITLKDNGIHAMVFFGDHTECDKWLDANKGYTLTLHGEALKGLKYTNDIETAEPTGIIGKITEGSLLSKLKTRYLDVVMDNVNAKIFRSLEIFDSFSSEDEILEKCSTIKLAGVQEMILDVLIALKEDNVDGAKNRILLFENEIIKLEDATKEEVDAITSGEEYILLDDFQGKDIQNFMNGASWLDWMLFMHPQQRKVVDEDFNGSSRLLGVSGSGKTCVTVNRAIRLAKKYAGEKILVTTINPALAQLIKNLVTIALESENNKESILSQIDVKSFSDVKRDLLLKLETNDLKRKSINEYSDKQLEDVDQIWKEYYLCENNNDDARILLDVHKSLLNRSILPLQYLKEEFDWIRSALVPEERLDYLNIEREGRSEPFTKEYRELILSGLTGWENKMEAVGVSDYLGLLTSLYKYIDNIIPIYRCILVDELQDFGTTELSVLRKLVSVNENDLFLCGDIAQRVHSKQHKLISAGIQISPKNYKKIIKNYRNSRQILEAAASVFSNNVNPEDFNSKDFDLLNPEFANFSTPKPFLRSAHSFYEELDYSLKYLESILSEGEKGCIAICGYSYFQVQSLGKKLNLKVLDGFQSIDVDSIFLSDLNQTKGFEFDRMIIINCGKGVLPNVKIPQKEWFREISRLYVSMTRAKKELIISESSGRSEIFEKSIDLFVTDTSWSEYVAIEMTNKSFNLINNGLEQNLSSLKNEIGHDFLYSDLAVGLTTNCQDKLLSVVNGIKSSDHNNRTDKWRNMFEFINDLNNNLLTPHMNKVLGQSVYKELKEKFPAQQRVAAKRI